MLQKIYLHADDYGRSKLISKNILNCIKNGSVNSVSVIMNCDQQALLKLRKLKNINIKVHLNLTEISYTKSRRNNLLSKLSFFKIIFLSKKEKKIVINEIDDQVKKFIIIFNPKKLKIDSHEHIHMIPWIYNYICKKYKKSEIRYSSEDLILSDYRKIFSKKYYSNLFKLIIIKMLSCFHYEKKNSPKFWGLLNAELFDSRALIKLINNIKEKNFSDYEILLHPGYTNSNELSLFKSNYFNFYTSNARKKDYSICISKLLKKHIDSKV